MNRFLRLVAYFIIFIAMAFGLSFIFDTIGVHKLYLNLETDCISEQSPLEIFYTTPEDNEFTQEKSFAVYKNGSHTLKLPSDLCIKGLRIDFGNVKNGNVCFNGLEYSNGNIKNCTIYTANGKMLELHELDKVNDLQNGGLQLKTVGNDPYIIINDIKTLPAYNAVGNNYVYKAVSVLISLFVVLLLYKFVHLRKIADAFRDMYAQRKLILKLSVNDFKTRFAGSSFGTVWAFVQPICTILVFWFVFQVGFRNPDVGNVQYILWFMTGLIPWFFFSEAWNSATNAFIEYSYLVKKVVFKINILPFIKIISALFVHLFFVVFMITVYALYGRFPTAYYLQIIYYMVCMVVLVAALSFITAPLMIFFRDIGQIMNIVLQFGMWLTPIMWSVDSLPQGMSGIVNLFKINPMYYIVQGYRNSMIYNVPFYNNILQTVYFWVLILVMIIAGNTIYTRLKPHFADVL